MPRAERIDAGEPLDSFLHTDLPLESIAGMQGCTQVSFATLRSAGHFHGPVLLCAYIAIAVQVHWQLGRW